MVPLPARGLVLPLFSGLIALTFLFLGTMAEAEGFDLRSELILDLRLDGEPLQVDVIAYQRDGALYVSLLELMEGLEFPINVDAQSGQAGGWFVSEEREFLLDLDTANIISDGDTFTMDAGAAVVFEEALYVDTQALEAWFPLRLEPVLRELALNVEATESLPLQQRMQRRAGRTRGTVGLRRQPQLPLQQTPYRWLGPHTTDLRLTTSSVRNNDNASSSQSANYSLLSRGDLGKMTSSISLTGQEDEITSGRIRLEREVMENPLNLNLVEVGDVNVGGARGLVLRGGPTQGSLEGRFAGESVDLRGDILPGWEVELYRNGVLLDFQVVGDLGQYEFLQVPLELGENRFEFVLLGPFGEERREEEVYFVGPDVLDWGAVSYEFAAVQSERSVVELGDGGGSVDRNSGRYLANFNVGLGRNLTARGGVDSFEKQGRRLENYVAGLNLAVNTFQASTAYSFRPEQQDLLNSSFRTRLGSSRLSLGHSLYFDDGLDTGQLGANPFRWSGNASLSVRPWQVPVAFETRHTKRAQSTSTDASLGTTLRAGPRNRLSKSFNYSQNDNRDLGLEREEAMGGGLSFATSLRPWRLRVGSRYTVKPESELTGVNASASLRVERNMTLNFEVRRNRISDLTSYLAGFNWQLASFQLSPRMSYDSNERWVGLVSLSTSLVPRPGRRLPALERLSHANTGLVHARVFMDTDGDGEFGPLDEALGGVRVDAVQAFRHAETGEDGYAYLRSLQRGRQTDIALDPSTLPDFELEPAHLGRSVRPRAGSVSTVDFPVIRAMELEGHVRIQTEDGPVPAKRVLVALLDAEGEVIRRQRTAFDGFYLFSGVPPGEYRLRLGEDNAGQVTQSPGTLTLGSEGGIKRGLDFMLEQKSQRTLFDSAPGARERGSFIPESETGAESVPDLGPLPELRPELRSELRPEPAPENEEISQGNWTVQLGAFSQRATAQSYWQTLSGAHSALFEGLQVRYVARAGLTRLMVSPGISTDSARTLCSNLNERGVDCLVREIDE